MLRGTHEGRATDQERLKSSLAWTGRLHWTSLPVEGSPLAPELLELDAPMLRGTA